MTKIMEICLIFLGLYSIVNALYTNSTDGAGDIFIGRLLQKYKNSSIKIEDIADSLMGEGMHRKFMCYSTYAQSSKCRAKAHCFVETKIVSGKMEKEYGCLSKGQSNICGEKNVECCVGSWCNRPADLNQEVSIDAQGDETGIFQSQFNCSCNTCSGSDWCTGDICYVSNDGTAYGCLLKVHVMVCIVHDVICCYGDYCNTNRTLLTPGGANVYELEESIPKSRWNCSCNLCIGGDWCMGAACFITSDDRFWGCLRGWLKYFCSSYIECCEWEFCNREIGFNAKRLYETGKILI